MKWFLIIVLFAIAYGIWAVYVTDLRDKAKREANKRRVLGDKQYEQYKNDKN